MSESRVETLEKALGNDRWLTRVSLSPLLPSRSPTTPLLQEARRATISPTPDPTHPPPPLTQLLFQAPPGLSLLTTWARFIN